MKPTEQTCDLQRIEAYLDERLNDALVNEFEQHLCVCERCRNELQKRSAEPSLWRDAMALLGPDSTPDSVFGSHRKNGIDSPDSSEQTIDESRSIRLEQYVASVLDSLAPTDDPEMLGRVGDYEISGVVGVGGMGAVLKGFDKSLRRVVAIKVMAPHLAHSGSARTRFQREARAAAAITHDNVVDIYAVSEASGLPYLVMPYARGPSLQKRIDEGGPLGVVEVVRIGRQIAAGLSAAHEQGLVHRDIKPANILLSDGIERLWITDFGVARAMDDASMTQTGVIAGTPQYMSPEQARGEAVDHRSDLFSLGSVLYTACTGRPPFRSEAAYGILRRITDSDPRPIREINPDIPEWLNAVIVRLLAKHPADRFESAREVVELFDGCLAHLQQPLQVALPPSLRRMPMLDANRTFLSSVSNRNDPQVQAGQPPRRIFSKRGMIMLGSLFLAGLLSILTFQMTSPTDISGHWTGENWQHVNLASVDEASDWYSGTFIDASGRRGALRLEWSRMQRRYNGRWKVGDTEAGQITLRSAENGTLRGAVSVDPESPLEPEVPRLLEFIWQPASEEAKQSFKSKTPDNPKRRLESDRPVPDQAVSIPSPTQGFILRMSDEIQLNARVQQGDFIAEIESNDSAYVSLQRELDTSKLELDVASSRIEASERDLEAARQICAAIEAQIRNIEIKKQQNAVAIENGLRSEATALEDQSNLDTAIVALKKAEADAVKVESELRMAQKKRMSCEQEAGDLHTKLAELSRFRLVAPVAGKITSIGTFRQGDMVQVGDVICKLTPDAAQSSAPEENAKNSAPAPTPAPATGPATAPAPTRTEAPVSDLGTSSLLQGLSGFGPGSELAKRLRESREKLEKIPQSLVTYNIKLKEGQERLLSLREKQKEDTQHQAQLAIMIDVLEKSNQEIESKIKSLDEEKKRVAGVLAEAEHEQEIIIQIVQEKIVAAHSQLAFKQESKERAAYNHQNGLSTDYELRMAEQAIVEAESELRQLRLLHEFYRNLGRNDAE